MRRTAAFHGLAMVIAAGAAVAHDALPRPDQPLAARYETVGADRAGRVTRKSDWYLVRSANRIETAGNGRAELWERSPQGGDVSMRRVFWNEAVVLEYHAGDLRAMNMEPAWRALGTVLDPEVLSALTETGSRKMLGHRVQVYRGGAGRDRLKVWWIKALSLPALVKRTGELGTYTMKLVETRNAAPAEWPLASRGKTDDFRVVDAADLGDLEHDPVVKRILRADASRHPESKPANAHD